MDESDMRIDADAAQTKFPAPDLPYQPPTPESPVPGIGLIGCGAISSYHLEAYRDAGLPVLALCDRNPEKLAEKRERFYPDATAYTDLAELLADGRIEFVDIATHAEGRAELIEAALRAGKHVLSQKPFVTDLAEGERLVKIADEKQRLLAVNQNGRWAPHFSWMRHAIEAGLIGSVTSVDCAVHWDHSWTAGTPYDDIRHLVLYDFGIHWFDFAASIMGEREAQSVYAHAAPAAGQTNRAPLLAQAAIAYEDARVSIVFNAATSHGASDRTVIVGTKGTLISQGPDLSHQSVTLYTNGRGGTRPSQIQNGYARPVLQGEWFKQGFLGAMTELIAAVQQNRIPNHNARDNLRSLALCLAACQSADTAKPIRLNQ